MAKKKYKLEEGGYYPDGVIRQPEPSESVAREEIGFDTEQGVVITKMDDVNLDYTREDGR